MFSILQCTEDFLKRDLWGEHVWLNPPFNNVQKFIQHYLEQKRKNPQTMSACIVVPHWKKLRIPELKGMQVIAQYSKGHVLFTAPIASGQRRRLLSIIWRVSVYYDPPVPSMYTSMHCKEGQLTMGLQGKVSKSTARSLIDTGASGTHYISKAFCNQIGLTFETQEPESVTMADGSSTKTGGTVTVPIQIQSYRAKLPCYVMDMIPEYDIILGARWLIQNQTVIVYGEQTCSLQ